MTLQLEVGRTYRNREGEKVKIVSMRAATAYRYEGNDGCHYTAEGCFHLESPEHGFDLVEECEPDEPAAEAPKNLPLCEAILAEIRQEASEAPDGRYSAAVLVAEAIIRKHFAALSVEEITNAIRPNLQWVESPSGGMRLDLENAAQAVMKLLRKESEE